MNPGRPDVPDAAARAFLEIKDATIAICRAGDIRADGHPGGLPVLR